MFASDEAKGRKKGVNVKLCADAFRREKSVGSSKLTHFSGISF
jgi:hypothetical protein